MSRAGWLRVLGGLLAGGTWAGTGTALAHVVVGARVFPVTLTFDDPGVSDEISVPALGYGRSPPEDGGGAGHEVDLGLEFDKTITRDTALILNDSYGIQQMNGAKTQTGWDNLVVTGKWQAWTDGPHEWVMSLGLQRTIGGSGTTHTGADPYGATTPTLYMGKGFGDLPVAALRPFAVSGELAYSVADKGLKLERSYDAQGGLISSVLNRGDSNAWNGGMSLQYSVPYLQSEVRDLGLRGVLGGMIPIVELSWSSPAGSPSNEGTMWHAAPGVIWMARWGEIGLEAVVPLNRASGPNVGVAGLVHVFLDDVMPGSLGRPLF